MKKYKLLFLLLIVLVGAFLRFNKMEKDPPGLYVDEASIGYNAYTILKTGQDEYGVKYPIFFRAFGEYKMPVYIYATAISMAVFGKNEFAVRFPSALSGTLTIIVFYFFLTKIIELDKWKDKYIQQYLPVLAAFLLALSSWHIHFSRGGFEVTLGIFLFVLGSYIFLLFWEKKKLLYLLLSALCFVLTMYTYNVFRILTPVTLLILSVWTIKKLSRLKNFIIISAVIIFTLSIPLILFSLTPEGASRFLSTSAFSEYPTQTTIQKVFIYPMVFIKNYFTFFSFDFLFNNGDGIGRHQLPGFGELFRWQMPFLILGLISIFKQKKSPLKYITFGLLFLSPISAALVRPSPHSLRSLLLVLPLTVFIAIGILYALDKIKKGRKAVLIGLVVIALYEFSIYIHGYYVHYPIVNALDWGAANKETVQKTAEYKKKYDFIVVDSKLISSYIYFKFYDDSLKFSFIDNTWKKPANWRNKRILYIALYDIKSPPLINSFDQVYFPGAKKDIYTQFLNL